MLRYNCVFTEWMVYWVWTYFSHDTQLLGGNFWILKVRVGLSKARLMLLPLSMNNVQFFLPDTGGFYMAYSMLLPFGQHWDSAPSKCFLSAENPRVAVLLRCNAPVID